MSCFLLSCDEFGEAQALQALLCDGKIYFWLLIHNLSFTFKLIFLETPLQKELYHLKYDCSKASTHQQTSKCFSIIYVSVLLNSLNYTVKPYHLEVDCKTVFAWTRSAINSCPESRPPAGEEDSQQQHDLNWYHQVDTMARQSIQNHIQFTAE